MIRVICRIPGKGTDVLINRSNEYDCYMAVKDLHITEKIIYFDKESGYKISKFYDGSKMPMPLIRKKCQDVWNF